MVDFKRVLFAVTLGLMLLPLALTAQGAGKLEGSVTRADGSGIGGVTVIINETGAVTVTRRDGTFTFDNVPAGSYTVSFTLGDNQTTESGVEVTGGGTTQLDKSVDWTVSFAETITVVSASRRPERIVEAPAAVTFVTEEEIERQASHGQAAKLLEFTPGAEVTQSGLYDYNFNTRGFNSSLTRRVAVLIDGRDPSVPFLGSQEWASLTFPLDDIASLEVVRGPSAALYGANASSGIVNIITKQARYSQGGQLRIAAGDVSTLNADARWAGELGADWYLKIQGGVRDSGDFSVSRNGAAEYAVPCTVRGQTDCLPQELVPLNPLNDVKVAFGSLRVDKYLSNGSFFTLEAGDVTNEGVVAQTGIGRVQQVDVERQHLRGNFSSTHWNVLGYYNKRDAPRQTALSSGTNLVLDTNNTQFEVQTNWDFASGKARIVAGATYGEENIDTLDPGTGRQTLIFEPVDSDSSAAFAQLDWSLSDKVKVVLAGRYDESSLHDTQFSPKGAVVVSLTPNNTLRFTYNESFQVANYSEFFLQANVAPPLGLQGIEAGFCAPFGVSCGFGPGPTRILALGNKDLEVEEVKAFEVGYSGILGGKAYLTVDYYNSRNENFITDLLPQLGTVLGRINPNFGPYTPPAGLPAPVAAALVATLQGALGPSFALLTNNLDGTPILGAVSYTNFGQVDTQGVDLGLNYYINSEWSFNLAYSWFDFDIKEDTPGFNNILLPNSPQNKFSIGLAYAGTKWNGDVSLRSVDKFRWSVGPFQGDVKSYTTVDINGNYVINDHFQVGVTIANAFDDEHYEAFGGDLLSRRALANLAISF